MDTKLTITDLTPLPVTDLKHVMREIMAMRLAREAIRRMRREDCLMQNKYNQRKKMKL